MANLNTIKSWFKTGLKPTQAQFWETWDSFFHIDSIIPSANIENLDQRFNEKADQEAFQSHVDDLTAHGMGQLFFLLKTSINVENTLNIVIAWQTDIVLNGTQTFAAKHGNEIPRINGVYSDALGVMTPYAPNYTYTLLNGLIDSFTITDILEGTTLITII